MEDELVKEQPVYEIQKVKLKNNQVTADYTERFVEKLQERSNQIIPAIRSSGPVICHEFVKDSCRQDLRNARSRSCKYRKSFG